MSFALSLYASFYDTSVKTLGKVYTAVSRGLSWSVSVVTNVRSVPSNPALSSVPTVFTVTQKVFSPPEESKKEYHSIRRDDPGIFKPRKRQKEHGEVTQNGTTQSSHSVGIEIINPVPAPTAPSEVVVPVAVPAYSNQAGGSFNPAPTAPPVAIVSAAVSDNPKCDDTPSPKKLQKNANFKKYCKTLSPKKLQIIHDFLQDLFLNNANKNSQDFIQGFSLKKNANKKSFDNTPFSTKLQLIHNLIIHNANFKKYCKALSPKKLQIIHDFLQDLFLNNANNLIIQNLILKKANLEKQKSKN